MRGSAEVILEWRRLEQSPAATFRRCHRLEPRLGTRCADPTSLPQDEACPQCALHEQGHRERSDVPVLRQIRSQPLQCALR